MTSANSSLARFFNEQKALFWRRIPLVALAILMYFLYDVFGTVTVIQREMAFGNLLVPFELRAACSVAILMGVFGMGWFISCVGAVLLAIQGFSYLFKTQTVDFYESRPEKRSVRFVNIAVNSLLIYLIPSFLGAVFSFLIAMVNGCGFGWLFADIMLTWCLQTVLFMAVYAMSSFATLLTGTLVTAVMMNMFVFSIEWLVRVTIFGFRAAFYATFDSESEIGILTNVFTLPPFHYIKGSMMSEVNNLGPEKYGIGFVSDAMMKCVPASLVNLLIFAVAIAAAYLLYSKRKAEFAGRAVIYRPVADGIKILCGVIFSLETGLIVYLLFERQDGAAFPIVIVTMIITILVTSMIAESVFGQNVRAAFYRAFEMPIIAVIAFIILFVYWNDSFGYDRWLPKEAEVESAWLLNYNYPMDYYDENNNYVTTRDHISKNMKLTDIEDMLKIAAAGQEKAVAVQKGSAEDAEDAEAFWNAVIGWRMKNGKTVTKCINIPYDIDPQIMDNIIGSKEFIDSVYHLGDAEEMLAWSKKMNNGKPLVLDCTTEHGEFATDERAFKGFLDTYRQDVEKNYDFTLASNNNPVGNVCLHPANYSSDYYTELTWPIYSSYKDTISYMEEHEMWQGGFLEPGEVKEIKITTGSYDENDDYITSSETYDDEDDIEAIMDASLPMYFYSAWVNYSKFEDTGYDIEVYPEEDLTEDGTYGMSYYRRFYKGKVPGFIGSGE